MANITVEVDGTLYSRKCIDNTTRERIQEWIDKHQKTLSVHQELIDSGIFGKEFKS